MGEKRLAIANREPTDLEKEIAKVIYDLAQSSSENREDFKNIYIAGATEFQINQLGKRDKRVVLIYVPYPSLKSAQKLHFKIVNEIQKKKEHPSFYHSQENYLDKIVLLAVIKAWILFLFWISLTILKSAQKLHFKIV